MKRLIASCVAGSLAASLACDPCFAWGDDGHKIVATIATSQLSEPAQRALRELLGDETVADAAVWADKVRSDAQYDWIKPLHYINVPRGATSVDGRRDAVKEGEIVSAIIRYRGVLKDRSRPKEERLLALRLVMHLVGTDNIRDVIAFPKTQSGGDLMIDAPGPIDEQQITDCGMKVTLIEKK